MTVQEGSDIASFADESEEDDDEDATPDKFEGDNNIDGMLDQKHPVHHINIEEDEEDL